MTSRHNPISRILYTNILTGPNFDDWLRNLRIVLTSEGIEHVLTENRPDEPAVGKLEEEVLESWQRDDVRAKYYMLASMSTELQKQHVSMNSSYSILLHLDELFGVQGRMEKFRISQELFSSRMSEGTSATEHVLKMISSIETLQSLGLSMDFELQIDLILQSLPRSFLLFLLKTQTNNLAKTLAELLNMIMIAETTIKRGKSTDLAAEMFSPRRKFARTPPPTPVIVNERAVPPAGISSLLVIETVLTVTSTLSWVLDSGTSTHICNLLQDLQPVVRLDKGEISLRMGNGSIVAAAAKGRLRLALPTGSVLGLDGCFVHT